MCFNEEILQKLQSRIIGVIINNVNQQSTKVISWWSILLVERILVTPENHGPLDKLVSDNVVSSAHINFGELMSQIIYKLLPSGETRLFLSEQIFVMHRK